MTFLLRTASFQGRWGAACSSPDKGNAVPEDSREGMFAGEEGSEFWQGEHRKVLFNDDASRKLCPNLKTFQRYYQRDFGGQK